MKRDVDNNQATDGWNSHPGERAANWVEGSREEIAASGGSERSFDADRRTADVDRSGFDSSAANGVGFLPVAFGVIGSAPERVADGRVLQAFLGSSVDFQVWFMGAVSRARLRRGVDYQRAGPPRVDPRTGRSGVDVVFSISAAKSIAMMSGGSRGNAIREYFIEQSRRLIAGESPLPFFAELQH